MKLPDFQYHPDPLATGAVKAGGGVCDCCSQARGFEYTASFYTAHDEDLTLCPWCIANGDAARKYEGVFSDDVPLIEAGLPASIVREVCERTPGYSSWQQEIWQSHCGDACEFHGDAEPAELSSLSGDALACFLNRELLNLDQWRSILAGYQKGGNPAVYKFVCRQCRVAVFTMDCT